MIAVRGQPATTLERVADRPDQRAGSRKIQPQRDVSLLEIILELLVRHTRLDERRPQLRIHLEDAIHAPQIENHLSACRRCRGSIAKVAPGGDGPYGHLGPVADGQDPFDLLDRDRHDHSGGHVLLFRHRHQHPAVRCNVGRV